MRINGTINSGSGKFPGVVSIKNNGVNVPFREHLFEPLHPASGGTGLGLYISRAIVRTYGGELQYLPSGGGSLFFLQLPVLAPMEELVDA